jgi:ubiquinone/menaquinone biosynthesis C-methylase UbiE
MREPSWSQKDVPCLNSASRRATQDPAVLWSRVGLESGQVVVDVGAGSGYFSFPAASRVGEAGRVYAVDVSADLVQFVRERAERARIRNVQAVLSTPERIPLEDAVADVTLLANVFHGIPPATVLEAVRVLRPGGRLVNVDWKKEPSPEGPDVRHRLSKGEAEAALSAYGLSRLDSFDLGPYHYVLVFERPLPSRRPRRLVSAE